MTRSDARRLKLARDLAEVHAMADAVLSRARAAKVRTAPRRAASMERKAARRMERAARTANVRVEVFKRDGGRCVVCGAEATDMHHLVYGSGLRRVLESGQTCAALCREHHAAAHAGRVSTLDALLAWAIERRYSLAADALRRRSDRLAALRSTPTPKETT